MALHFDAGFRDWLFGDNARAVIAGIGSSSGRVQILTSAYGPDNDPSVFDVWTERIIGATYRQNKDQPLAVGQLTLDNRDGAFDGILYNPTPWIGAVINLYLGSPAWAQAQFVQVATGLINNVTGDEARLIVDFQTGDQYNRPLITDFVSSGEPIPRSFGFAWNVSPPLADATLLDYAVAASFSALSGVYSVKVSGDPASSVTTATPGGRFHVRFTAAVPGTVTADLIGAGGSAILTGTVIEQLLGSSSIESGEVAALNAVCNQEIGGAFVDRVNTMEAVQELLEGVGAFHFWSRDGRLKMRRFDYPLSTTVAFNADQIIADSLRLGDVDFPVSRVRVGYSRNYTVQAPETIAGAVLAGDRAEYGQEWRNADVGAAGQAEPPARPSFFSPRRASGGFGVYTYNHEPAKANATAEANRLLALYGTARRSYTASFVMPAFPVDLGDTIEVQYPRFGFAAGLTGAVTAVDEDYINNRCEVTLWR